MRTVYVGPNPSHKCSPECGATHTSNSGLLLYEPRAKECVCAVQCDLNCEIDAECVQWSGEPVCITCVVSNVPPELCCACAHLDTWI